ncbi:TolC family protein [Andreprevotia chitinilytica]|uniref:TolC family protein n=1 Tax=Andreprevotia chitinilytica TaxID=396808 RepID=UPI0006918600|nr:TolC family protein [Andreprevotia chitinilytica]
MQLTFAPFTAHRWTPAALAVLALALGGCASFSPDGGLGPVQHTAKEQLGKDLKPIRTDADASAVQAEVQTRLQRPLSVDDAEQIALLNNKQLQASFAELGIADADRMQAGRLPNPKLSYRSVSNASTRSIEAGLGFDIAQLLTLPIASRIEHSRFEQMQLRVAGDVLMTAQATRQAYYRAVAAQQTLQYLEQVQTTAEISAELGQRMVKAGNWSKLDQARQRTFQLEATSRLVRARQSALAEREQLTRLLGLWGTDAGYTLPERLPDLPATARDDADIERHAIEQRFDIQAQRKSLDELVRNLGLTRATRFINVLEVGLAGSRDGDEAWQRGYDISLEVPLFDWGDAKVARAEATYLQGVHRLAATAVNARSEVREAYHGYRSAFDQARHYRDDVLPLRKQISEENQLRYNGMLISLFELLDDTREQAISVNEAIESQRDFWLADSTLRVALAGAAPSPNKSKE